MKRLKDTVVALGAFILISAGMTAFALIALSREYGYPYVRVSADGARCEVVVSVDDDGTEHSVPCAGKWANAAHDPKLRRLDTAPAWWHEREVKTKTPSKTILKNIASD